MSKAFPLCAALLLVPFLTGCVITDDYVAFDSKVAPNRQVKTFDEGSWESERALIQAAETAGNWNTVISVANDVVAKNPTNVSARVALARAQTKTGDPTQALRTLSFITGVSTTPLQIELARALMALHDRKAALQILQPILATVEKDPTLLTFDERRTAQTLSAVAYAFEGKFGEADQLYEKLLAESDDATVRYNYARSLLLEGRAEDALAQLRPIMDVIPVARPTAVAALLKLGREPEARALLKGVIPDEKIDALMAAVHGGAQK